MDVILKAVFGLKNLSPRAGPPCYIMYQYYVYILASKTRVLYTGVTNDLARRLYEHKSKAQAGFTQKYNATRLVYYEATSDVRAAIQREKEIKGWLRRKKVALIESANPGWKDLSADWGAEPSKPT